jgi:tetratricopeptide (TPR) repeat protein
MSRYVHLLVELHRLTALNLDETEAADQLRDEMDLPWRRMTPEELRMVRDLSADLYTITDPAPPPVSSFPQEVDASIARSLRDEDWVRVLHVVRDNEASIPLHAAAFLRGFCWSQLGLHEAGAEFFRHAVESEPQRSDYRTYLLCSLVYSGREKEALPLAEQWSTESPDRWLQLTASNVLFIKAAEASGSDAVRLHQMAIQVAERAIQQTAPPVGLDEAHLITTAFLHVALSYAYLGDLTQAKAAWQKARELSPNSLDAIMVGSILHEATNTLSPAARRDVARYLVGGPPEQSEESAPLGFPRAFGSSVESLLAH